MHSGDSHQLQIARLQNVLPTKWFEKSLVLGCSYSEVMAILKDTLLNKKCVMPGAGESLEGLLTFKK